MTAHRSLACLAALLGATSLPAQVQLTIDPSARHQTMEGWGFSQPGVVSMARGINPLASFPFQPGADRVLYELLFDVDSGLGMTHVSVYQHWDADGFWSGATALTYEEVNDDDDPLHIDWSGFALTPDWPQWRVMRRFAERGAVLKLQLGPFPEWMKADGVLAAGMRDEFAEYVVAMLLYARDTMHIDVPMLTIRNEPDKGGPQFTESTLAGALSAVAKMLERYDLPTRLVAPETSSTGGGILYPRQFLGDRAVRRRMAALSVHPYGGDNVRAWTTLAKLAKARDLPVWQGEFGAFGTDYTIDNAVALALAMQRQIVEGDVTCWFHFLGLGSTTGRGGGAEGALIIFTPADGAAFTYALPPRFHGFGQFSRHVRPGDVRIDVHGARPPVAAIAFQGPDAELMVVLVNDSTAGQTVVIDGWGDRTAARAHRTSAGEDGASLGAVQISSGRLTTELPAKSITTLTSRGVDGEDPSPDPASPATGRASGGERPHWQKTGSLSTRGSRVSSIQAGPKLAAPTRRQR